MAKLVDRQVEGVNRFLVIDCRFEYEFVGGHIRDAINVKTPEDLEEIFISSPPTSTNGEDLILIFHCEFSSVRGPNL